MVTKVTTAVIEDSSITNDKIDSLETTKLTGTITNSQLAGGIENSKITSLAYSKLTGAPTQFLGPTTPGAVGTYAFTRYDTSNGGLIANVGDEVTNEPRVGTGTWRCMHKDTYGGGITGGVSHLWLRIA